VDDRGLYAPGQLWLQREDILGRAKGTLRYLGMVTIILNDYPVLKYVLIGEHCLSSTYVMCFVLTIRYSLFRCDGSFRADQQGVLKWLLSAEDVQRRHIELVG
jgi:hypothetical protein